MRKSSPLAITATLLLSATLLTIGGCGYKTEPVPPQAVVPEAINDLRYTLDDNGAVLNWSYPLQTIDGQDIVAISSFDLFRAEMPLADFCSGCPIPYSEPVEIPGEVVDKASRKTVEHYSGLLRSGNKYFFKVRSRTSWLASSRDSNIVTFVYHTPVAAPQNVVAQVKDAEVRLRWTPSTTLIDGKTADLPVRYQVLRSDDDKQYDEIGHSLETTSYVDADVEIGKDYYYRVQSNLVFRDAVIDGSLSSTVKAEVLDTIPPPLVTGVTVIPSSQNVRVFWDRVAADDLAGYRIYRREAGDKKLVKVGEVSATQTIFVDAAASAEAKLYYAVTSFDGSGNESELSEEATSRH
jgi:fibronectin type 3 domain-containing protein